MPSRISGDLQIIFIWSCFDSKELTAYLYRSKMIVCSFSHFSHVVYKYTPCENCLRDRANLTNESQRINLYSFWRFEKLDCSSNKFQNERVIGKTYCSNQIKCAVGL